MTSIIRSIIIISISFLYTYTAQANGNTIRVGIDSYDPPFIYNINNKTFYGFDVDTMSEVCRIINKKCEF